ncbi:hypothetical protein M9H77_26711 [Catharanthus roseus]|uniref:Uncharacterized protein n=1 Tax=Catharanthus roseus TaxID=4058 RepID=A0ACC0AD61_CATRO|nr:hypothetical protein M9H77_26711 [Catharanthus roseus]
MELDQVDIDPKGSINLDEEEFVEINSKSIADDYINLLSRKGGLKQNNSTYDPKDEVNKVSKLDDFKILKYVDLLLNDQRKFETFVGLPNNLKRQWILMRLAA